MQQVLGDLPQRVILIQRFGSRGVDLLDLASSISRDQIHRPVTDASAYSQHMSALAHL